MKDASIPSGVYDNLRKYLDIMKKYRNGEFGSETLSLHEILERAGEPNLLDQMCTEELDILINNSFGLVKNLYIMKKKELIYQQENGNLMKR